MITSSLISFNSVISSSLWSSMPNTNGICAIGIWMLACIIMVFSALIEYGIILFIMMKKQKSTTGNKCNMKRNNSFLKSNPLNVIKKTNGEKRSDKMFIVSPKTFEMNPQNKINTTDGMKQSAFKEIDQELLLQKIDYVSLYIFPLSFLFFIAAYIIQYVK